MHLIAQGAEAKLYKDGKVLVKERFSKKYRLPEIDHKLKTARTKREANILRKLRHHGFPVPQLEESNDKGTLKMELVDGPIVRDVLEKKDYKALCHEIGRKVAQMHNLNIIHGDLTTSNMILGKEVFFIDFGLGFVSYKIEDMAVDLHLLKEALESRHYKVFEECYAEVLNGYLETAKHGKEVVARLDVVEGRGRYKKKKK